ncbi:MAG: HlyD family efflux transporter periplasmic adaptor subunit [Bacteroidaceae bacterium]|nr:HlyD family efflux transporter periplasmic adaptor subunit [Bacteroidaceae bacterium]
MKKIIMGIVAVACLTACSEKSDFDATGTFEAVDVIVSSEASGRILSFDAAEGMSVSRGEMLGVVDSVQLHLQRRQLKAQQAALLSSRPDIQKQVTSLREQIAKQRSEQTRVENMLRDGAATTKQLDDIQAQIRILEGQLTAMLSTLNSNSATIESNVEALEAQIALLDDRIEKCRIVSPIDGTVLLKYVEAGELATPGKPLMKIADLNNIYLRAYFTSDQLADIALGDTVTVTADFGGDELIDYTGRIAWISAESEFTPKSIQTKDSRANLVYAVKIYVENDGRIKIGHYGKVTL